MILISSIIATLFQILCIKLGVVTRNDLAQQCRKTFPRWLNLILYVLAEIAIIATDLAQVRSSFHFVYLCFILQQYVKEYLLFEKNVGSMRVC
jgi:NRAMP (natural resistance-associated macrophage protein)-like metal ion transporter